ncbi:MAG: LysM peptidoglycan-binding domain-containing protein [Chitinophagaceae bacterium]|nr:LysM peptidoglycan-binding domain-containing protein [Chitinophagaceae bacterium]
MQRLLFIACFIFSAAMLSAQKSEFVIEYINTYKQLAVQEMLRTGVPASIKLAQGIHETEAGRSDLVTRSKNHFGIKCKTGWDGMKVYHDDDERGECFRSYQSSDASYMDHSNFLRASQRYSFLFELDPADYKAWAFGLKKAGYATNIKYSHILIRLIEQYNLQQYSLIALGKIADEEDLLTGIRKPFENKAGTTAPVVLSEPEVQTQVIAEPATNYPSGEFSINKTSVVYAKAGTSLLAIAEEFDVSLKRLLDFNDLEREEVLIQGQLIYLQRKRKTGSEEFHIVKAGETLYSIAQAEGIRLESLLEYNMLQKGMEPAHGERLALQKALTERPRLNEDNIRKNGVSGPAMEQEEVEIVPTRHIVQPKGTLFGIARNYNTTTEKIIEWNKLGNTSLKKGQELIIYKN